MLRPTPGDPWGVEQHHWNTGAEENQQLNPGGPSNSWILLWKYAAHLTVFQKVWLYFINFILKVKVKVTETRNWLKCVIFSHI